MDIRIYAKALVPVAIMSVLGLLTAVGVKPEMTVEEVVTWLVTAIVVWAVPNKKA